MRRTLVVILLLLVGQFLLGMAINLFVKIPTDHPGAQPAEYFTGAVQSVTWAITAGPFWLILHALLGLVVAGIAVLARAIAARRRDLGVSTAVRAGAVLAAGFNGGSYLNYHEDFSSMLMAGGFALARAAYTFALYLAAPEAG